MSETFKIALLGNPNCGKTCIFNALTGTRQHVGNYPGVTVEKKSGTFSLGNKKIELIDLPGIYSLSSGSPEEKIVFQELISGNIDLIINVIDSTILQRSMYLSTQLAELHIPMIMLFNMSDDAERKGLIYDISKLEKYFGCPIIKTIGTKPETLRKTEPLISKMLENPDEHGMPMLSYGADVDETINTVIAEINKYSPSVCKSIPARFFAIKLLENDNGAMNIEELSPVHDEVKNQIAHLKNKHSIIADTFMADRRYAMLAGACRDAMSISGERRREISDKIDAIMTNKFLGLPIFLLIMYLTFYFTFTVADPLMGYIEQFFGFLADSVKNIWSPEKLPFLRDLVTDGIISGVGGVVVFLPNILFLFFAIALLEDSGYMARAAFVMDGIMRRFGLQGKSFVPLVLGFGCTVPAVMATRTIESERDRKVTIMVLPLMSCGARLPIYALIIPAFFAAKYQALAMWIIYLIGVGIALTAAKIMRNTLFKGDGEVYLMELPPYRMPSLKNLLLHMWDRGRMYLHKAGTIILLTGIILYICNTYPEKKTFSCDYDSAIESVENSAIADETKEEAIAELENKKLAESMEYTISGRVGKTLEPFFRPLGFDWKITTANIGALAAKEVFVAQMGILYSVGEADEESETLRSQLVRNYTPLQAFCIMLFCLLSIPCLATLAIIKREMNSWSMAICEALGLFALAYITTAVVFYLGTVLKIGTSIL